MVKKPKVPFLDLFPGFVSFLSVSLKCLSEYGFSVMDIDPYDVRKYVLF